MALPVETFFLHPDHQGTLQSQIQQMIAQGILSGRFQPAEKLPSTRKLATTGVSRITVTLAYTELLSNDYLTRGAGRAIMCRATRLHRRLSTDTERPDDCLIGHAPSGKSLRVDQRRPSPWIGRNTNIRSSMGRSTKPV